MTDFTVAGQLTLDTNDFETGVDRATAKTGQLSAAQDANTGYTAKQKAEYEAYRATIGSSTAATDAAIKKAQERAVAENQIVVALQAGSQAMRDRASNDNSAATRAAGSLASSAAGSASGYGRGIAGSFIRLAVANPVIAATVAGVAALTLVMAGAAHAAAESQARQSAFTLELQATGNAAGTTAKQLEQLVQSEAARAGAGRNQTAQALGALVLNPNLQSQAQLSQTLAIARDYAKVSGQDLPAAAQALSKALDGSSSSARALDQVWSYLSADQLTQIRQFEQQGDKAGVVSVVLSALTDRFKGANEQGATPLAKGLNDLGSSWTKFETAIGNSPLVQKLLQGTGAALQGIAQGINAITPSGSGNGPTTADLSGAKAQLAEAEQILANMQAQPNRLISPAKDIAQQAKVVADLKANVAYIQTQLANGSVAADQQQVGVALQAAQTAAERQLKDYVDNLQKFNTATQQRTAIQAEINQIQQRLSLGGLSADQVAASNQKLTQLNGQLYGLQTPLQQIQKQLDLSGDLDKLPPKLREIEAAGRSTYEAARKAGADHDQATTLANQARSNAAAAQATATSQQISLLSAEAQGALAVAAAYDKSRAAGVRAAADQAAAAAEASGAIAPGQGGAFAQETLEKNAAAAVSAQAEKTRAYDEQNDALQRTIAAEAISADAARVTESANRSAAVAITLRAQAEASGSAAIKAAAEQQIARYDQQSQRQLQLDRQRAGNQLNSQYDPQVNFQQRMANLAALQAQGLLTERTVAEATKQYEQDRLDASRDATDGMIAGLKRYADEATNAGKAASDGVKQGFQSLEDFGVQAVTTLKFSFSDLANSILSDIARVVIRQGITGPLASLASTGMNALLASLSGSGGYSYQNSVVGASSMHAGGMVGGAMPSMSMPLSLFAGARRYHTGGMVLGADEVPIIARRGERVLTQDQQGGWGGVPNIGITVVNNGPPVNASKGKLASDGAGGFNMELILDQVDDGLAGRVAQGRGKVYTAVKARFGVKDQARG